MWRAAVCLPSRLREDAKFRRPTSNELVTSRRKAFDINEQRTKKNFTVSISEQESPEY